ncbi:MAG: glycoside hydrolase family 88 protein [Bacteroidota bacterium]|nr:glycoside hydrolase family 88 protein [Bacteroidota bacterium]MDP4190533.1 glycoside hydrolase family 88 protein [Bacteroidota bacterium]
MKRKVIVLCLLAFSASLCLNPILAQTSSKVASVKTNAKLKSNKRSAQFIKANKPWSVRIAESFIMRHPANVIDDSVYNGKWTYDQGVFLEGLRQLYIKTNNKKYLNYIKTNIDMFVDNQGTIKTYKYTDFNIDNINTGRMLLWLYLVTNDKRYKTAADTLRGQIKNQPRTKSGGFWHKKIYPYQMWLDGLYMAEPFYTWYSKLFNEVKNYDDIAYQFTLIRDKTRDSLTGLFYHAWDESLNQKWADPLTGRSPNFWSRSMGWYIMAIVDVLDFFPKDNPKRMELIDILKDLSVALLKVRDKNSALWYQVTNMADRTGNYHEASASCMFAYAFAKGANMGYLDKSYLKYAKETFDGVINNLTTVEENGFVDLHYICKGAGLGGNPYRDGSFEYYISEQKKTNDLKGMGPFIMLAVELEKGKAI